MFVILFSMLISACIVPGSNLLGYSSLSDNGLDVNFYPLTSSNISKFKRREILPEQNPELDLMINDYQYKVGSGDVLNVLLWDHPELKMPAGYMRDSSGYGSWVQPDGTIYYPYVGNVYVEGKTVSEIREVMRARLSQYIESPQVDINVSDFRSKKVYITGEVVTPGKQSITNIPLTLLDAINQAGGLAEEADWTNVVLTRKGEEIKISLLALMQYGDMSQNYLLSSGDLIHVPINDAQKIFVMGEVNAPQLLKMDRMGMTLTEALSLVGGINESKADATGVFIIRNTSQFSEYKLRQVVNVYQLNIQDAAALILGATFELQAKDIVYVTTAPISRWNRVISQLFPSVAGFNDLSDTLFRMKSWK